MGSVPVTLRPSRPKEDAPNGLPLLVQQIAYERDGLYKVKEKDLEDEIAREELGIEDDNDQDNDDVKTKDLETQQRELLTKRMGMVQSIDAARNQAAMCLDLLSFQLKDEAPQSAMQTLSPYIKQTFPQGGLGLDKLQPPTPSPQDNENDNLTSLGWTLQSLNKSADLLLNSAKELTTEVEKETRYWKQLSEVKQKGWNICRIPRQKNLVGVKFGFAEAGPQFQTQGLAALRSDDEGNITLDHGASQERRVVQIAIEESGRTIAYSRSSDKSNDRLDIEARVREASDALFEAELFHEMISEARDLLAYNVKIIDNKIRVPLHNTAPSHGRILVISSVPTKQSHTMSDGSSRQQLDAQVDALALAARVCMTHIYRERFKRRSLPPKPLSNERQEDKKSTILRSLISFLHHQSAVVTIGTVGRQLQAAFKSAGIEYSFNTKSIIGSTPAGVPLVESVVSSLSTPYETFLSFSVPTTDATIRIDVTTALQEPYFGTRFRVVTEQDSNASAHRSSSIDLSEVESTVASICESLCVFIATAMGRRNQKWQQPDSSAAVLRKVDETTQPGPSTHLAVALTISRSRLVLNSRHSDGTKAILGIWPKPSSKQSLDDTLSRL